MEPMKRVHSKLIEQSLTNQVVSVNLSSQCNHLLKLDRVGSDRIWNFIVHLLKIYLCHFGLDK